MGKVSKEEWEQWSTENDKNPQDMWGRAHESVNSGDGGGDASSSSQGQNQVDQEQDRAQAQGSKPMIALPADRVTDLPPDAVGPMKDNTEASK